MYISDILSKMRPEQRKELGWPDTLAKQEPVSAQRTAAPDRMDITERLFTVSDESDDPKFV